ncbi:hypothetical protein P7B02_07735 [Caulobacter segnis]|uniref:magnesium chelatase subunit ChlI family protein n=1 Tax=Caulobacter segnis TaxID=88688 RepID=UPI00240EBA40|nr:hypothetical protein [Caulobacter segnis]MDG2521429.1 hypothetical protein [Caulobacter segnis]
MAKARRFQVERAAKAGPGAATLNARAEGRFLEEAAAMDQTGHTLLTRAAEAAGLTARGWTRTLRLARATADLDGSDQVRRVHVAEAVVYRRVGTLEPTA